MNILISFEIYDNECETIDYNIITLGRARVVVDSQTIWDEEDYLGMFVRSLMCKLAEMKDDEVVYVDHYDSSGFWRITKRGTEGKLEVGRGHTLIEEGVVLTEVGCEWSALVMALVGATCAFLERVKRSYADLIESPALRETQRCVRRLGGCA